ncbi:MAG: insulinase family protein [Fibrobacterales bacterium]
MKVFVLFLSIATLAFSNVNLSVKKEVLDNGLTILLYENSHAPIIACRLFYTTGSVHEKPGKTGIAHMLEHMLFKGTKKVGITDSIQDALYIEKIDSVRVLMNSAKRAKDSVLYKQEEKAYTDLLDAHRKLFIKDELWETYLKNGGTGLNAFTSDLMTAYFVTLPQNKLELYLWLEADRMYNAVLREFYPERDVVREERRMRYDDSPTGRYFESLTALFYEEHPYRNPTIGWASDIEHYTREMATAHYEQYYKPNNAILVLAGDFSSDEVLPLIKKYFDGLPRGKEHEEITIREPEQVGEKRLTQIKEDAQPRYDLLFHTPEVGDDDIYALDIIEGVLSGKSGRLYKELVLKQGVATSVKAGNAVKKFTSSFEVEVGLKTGVDHAQVEKLVWQELKRLQDKPISEYELQKVKNQVYARSARSLKNIEHVATQLAFLEMYGGWELINTFPESVSNVTAQQVQEAAKRYFIKSQSTVGVLLNKSMEDTE